MNSIIQLPPPELQPAVTQPRRKRGCKRTATQRTYDTALIEQFALRGVPHKTIADRIFKDHGRKISRQLVSYSLAKLREAWKAAALESFTSIRNKELRRLEIVSAEAFDAWDRSRRGKNGGNPAFLTAVLSAHDRLVKLIGLAAPEAHVISGPNNGPIEITAGPLTPERRLEVLRRHLQRLESAQAKPEPAALTAATA